MKRETGYYWVKFENDWCIGFYNNQERIFPWTFVANDFSFKENEIEEIDERPVIRQPNMTAFAEDLNYKMTTIDGSKLPELKNLSNPK